MIRHLKRARKKTVSNNAPEALRLVYGLTPQEIKVALAIAEGRGLAEAARALDLSPLTVRNHLQRVFVKTGLNRQAALTKMVTKFSL